MEKMSLYELRSKLGMSIREFAGSIGYTNTGIRDVEIGKNNISRKLFTRIKETYGVELINNPRTELLGPSIKHVKVHKDAVPVSERNEPYHYNRMLVEAAQEFLKIHQEELFEFILSHVVIESKTGKDKSE